MEIHPLIKVLTPIVGAAVAGRIAQDPELQRKISDSANYGKYVAKHKWNIVSPMHQMGLPLTQAAKHDLSKLGPKEFGPYRNWFEGTKGIKGSRDQATYNQWRTAVDHHYRAPGNLHHLRALKLNPAQVPLKYKMEAVADWYSVGKTKGIVGTSFPKWYRTQRATLPIDRDTREMIDMQLSKNAERLDEYPDLRTLNFTDESRMSNKARTVLAKYRAMAEGPVLQEQIHVPQTIGGQQAG